ncbi:unnamed protein product [Tilletia controversa]|nr:unnamed protein product [Tilletia controversa]
MADTSTESLDSRRAAVDEDAVAKKKSRTSPKKKATVDDFEMIRVLGKGCAGKVLLVRHHETSRLFAMKSIHKRHVLAHQELQHTLTEQAVLKRMAREVNDPFVVRLWWSFHDKYNLYLVMDFHPGGDLATQLSRWGRLGRDRARFYAAEIVEGVEGLHRAGVIYRDLKPENVLIGADGHIVLSDFGLSKEFPREPHSSSDTSKSRLSKYAEERDVTTTFCGTAEYLAPEVIQGAAYSYEVDWWSFGTMLYEMLTGITPFWADTHADMYVRVLHDELIFPEDRVLDQDTKSILRGLLQRNPALRMKSSRIKRHPYFSMIEWAHVCDKPVAAASAAAAAVRSAAGDSDAKSLFDGYSFRGRRDSESIRSSIHSVASHEDDEDAERDAALDHIDNAIEAALQTPPRSSSTPQPPQTPSSAIVSPVRTSSRVVVPVSLADDDEDDDSAALAAEEDEDWDLLDNDVTIGSEANGGKGTSLWARGVVDTYRLLRRNESNKGSEPSSPALHTSSSYRLLRRKDANNRSSSGNNNNNNNNNNPKSPPTMTSSTSNGSNSFSSGALARLGTRSRRGLSQVVRRK